MEPQTRQRRPFRTLPSDIEHVYREVLIAYNAGLTTLTMAGLRILIETTAKHQGVAEVRGVSSIFRNMLDIVPNDSSLFKSGHITHQSLKTCLRDVWEEGKIAIHDAVGDGAVFSRLQRELWGDDAKDEVDEIGAHLTVVEALLFVFYHK